MLVVGVDMEGEEVGHEEVVELVEEEARVLSLLLLLEDNVRRAS